MKKFKTKVEVSAHHIHLTSIDFNKLFKKNDLTVRNRLSQPGMFAAGETVEVVGPEDRLSNIRIVGPLREYSQVELSISDCIKIGVEAPLILSGVKSGEKVKVVGTKGYIIKDIAIVAKRHIHLSDIEAKKLKLLNGQQISAGMRGDRGLVFNNIAVRIDKNFRMAIHIDTDEGNAAGIEKISDMIAFF